MYNVLFVSEWVSVCVVQCSAHCVQCARIRMHCGKLCVNCIYSVCWRVKALVAFWCPLLLLLLTLTRLLFLHALFLRVVLSPLSFVAFQVKHERQMHHVCIAAIHSFKKKRDEEESRTRILTCNTRKGQQKKERKRNSGRERERERDM